MKRIFFLIILLSINFNILQSCAVSDSSDAFWVDFEAKVEACDDNERTELSLHLLDKLIWPDRFLIDIARDLSEWCSSKKIIEIETIVNNYLLSLCAWYLNKNQDELMKLIQKNYQPKPNQECNFNELFDSNKPQISLIGFYNLYLRTFVIQCRAIVRKYPKSGVLILQSKL